MLSYHESGEMSSGVLLHSGVTVGSDDVLDMSKQVGRKAFECFHHKASIHGLRSQICLFQFEHHTMCTCMETSYGTP